MSSSTWQSPPDWLYAPLMPSFGDSQGDDPVPGLHIGASSVDTDGSGVTLALLNQHGTGGGRIIHRHPRVAVMLVDAARILQDEIAETEEAWGKHDLRVPATRTQPVP